MNMGPMEASNVSTVSTWRWRLLLWTLTLVCTLEDVVESVKAATKKCLALVIKFVGHRFLRCGDRSFVWEERASESATFRMV